MTVQKSQFPNSVHHENLESTRPAASCFPGPDEAPHWEVCNFCMGMSSCHNTIPCVMEDKSAAVEYFCNISHLNITHSAHDLSMQLLSLAVSRMTATDSQYVLRTLQSFHWMTKGQPVLAFQCTPGNMQYRTLLLLPYKVIYKRRVLRHNLKKISVQITRSTSQYFIYSNNLCVSTTCMHTVGLDRS